MVSSRLASSVSIFFLLMLGGCDGGDPAPDGGADAATPMADATVAIPDAGTDAGPADTWTTFADDFMQTYCVRCHSTSPKDFNLIADVRANTATIRCGVTDVALADCGGGPPPRQFPVGSGPFPSDEERARLVRWLDAGAPE